MVSRNYTITEAMPIFEVSRTTITYWISTGTINAEKEKGKWVIDGQSIKDWQEFQALGAPAANKVIRKRFEIASKKNRQARKALLNSPQMKQGMKKEEKKLCKNGEKI